MMRGAPGLTFADPTQIETVKKELGITAPQEPASWGKHAAGVA